MAHPLVYTKGKEGVSGALPPTCATPPSIDLEKKSIVYLLVNKIIIFF